MQIILSNNLIKNPTDSLCVLFASGTSFYKICVKFFSDMFFSIIFSVLPNEFWTTLVFHTLGYDISCLVSFSSFLLYSFHAFLLDFCKELEIYFDTFCSSNFVIMSLYFCGKPYMSFLGTCLYSALPMQGASVPPLVRELRFYMPHGMAKWIFFRFIKLLNFLLNDLKYK